MVGKVHKLPDMPDRSFLVLFVQSLRSHIKCIIQSMNMNVYFTTPRLKYVFCWSHLAQAASSHSRRPVTMQPRQSAWHRRANRRAPAMPADGRAVRTGCEEWYPSLFTHIHTSTELSTVALCANSQPGSTPTLLSDRLIIGPHVEVVGTLSQRVVPQVQHWTWVFKKKHLRQHKWCNPIKGHGKRWMVV